MSTTDPQYVTPPTAGGPPQWSREDLDRARAQGQDELIVKARKAGQLADLLEGKAK